MRQRGRGVARFGAEWGGLRGPARLALERLCARRCETSGHLRSRERSALPSAVFWCWSPGGAAVRSSDRTCENVCSLRQDRGSRPSRARSKAARHVAPTLLGSWHEGAARIVAARSGCSPEWRASQPLRCSAPAKYRDDFERAGVIDSRSLEPCPMRGRCHRRCAMDSPGTVCGV